MMKTAYPMWPSLALLVLCWASIQVVHGFSTNHDRSVASRREAALFMSSSSGNTKKGKVLVLGGTGFVGQTVCRRASLEGYSVTSLSRRGLPPSAADSKSSSSSNTDYRIGDARKVEPIRNILNEGGYVAVIHCIGLLFDDASGLGTYNRFVSGSGSVPDTNSTYETITQLTGLNAIEATSEYIASNPSIDAKDFPFIFVSAAEVGWKEGSFGSAMQGGDVMEKFLAPEWLRRYLAAKRAVEEKLYQELSAGRLRPVILRPSLVYSLDRPASYLPVGAFFIGNRVGLPFVDRPVTVQALSNAMIRSISRQNVSGIQRYTEIDELNGR
mmetsp:Transcript_13195/g.36436  ORF Transcript_13195/g.36436 Transcript_13195/m.36436 type:complete len:327 (-) Transcript_13195:109-1089(-)